MNLNDLPQRWHLKLQAETGLDHLSAGDFKHTVNIAFEDGSTATFRFAFAIPAPDWKEVAVFTEHCGYHVFPLVGTTIHSDP